MERYKEQYATIDELKRDLQFDAIFLLCDAVSFEVNIQLMCDLIASRDGRVDGGNYVEEDR